MTTTFWVPFDPQPVFLTFSQAIIPCFMISFANPFVVIQTELSRQTSQFGSQNQHDLCTLPYPQ